jgi:Flp pilus assembly secretin CpaC
MKYSCAKLALLSIFSLGAIQSVGQPHQSQKLPTPDQRQAQQPTETAAYEFNSDDQVIELVIKGALGQHSPPGYSEVPVQVTNPQAYSNVAVRVTDTEIVLTGAVRTSSERDQVAKIATQNAGDRKIVNRINVISDTRQGPTP